MPVPVETLSSVTCYGGEQAVLRHRSEATGTDMTFSVFVPILPSNAGLCYRRIGVTA